MRRKMVRSAPPPPFGPPGVAAVVRAASLACQNAVKAQKFVPLQESSEESRLNAIGLNPVLAAMPPEWWPIIESIVVDPPLGIFDVWLDHLISSSSSSWLAWCLPE